MVMKLGVPCLQWFFFPDFPLFPTSVKAGLLRIVSALEQENKLEKSEGGVGCLGNDTRDHTVFIYPSYFTLLFAV